MNDNAPLPPWRAILDDLGWSKADLARRLGKHPNTVDRWGEDCPEYVMSHLQTQLFMRRVAEQLEALQSLITAYIAPRPKRRTNHVENE